MKKLSLKSIIAGVVALAGCIGAFLPWATVKFLGVSASISGTDGGDGWLLFFAFIAIAAIACAFITKEDIHLYAKIAMSILGAIILIIAIVKIADAGSLGTYASAGFGLYWIAIFSVLSAAAPWLPLKKTFGK